MKEIVDKDLLEWSVKKYQLGDIFDRGVISEMKLIELEKGEILCTNGDQMNHLYMLVQGKLKISTFLPNGKSLLLRFNDPLALIGDVEFIHQFEVKNHVEAVKKCLLIGLSYKVLHETCSDNPAFLTFLLKTVSYKLYTFSHSTRLNLLVPVENRFASYLVSTLLDEGASSFSHEIKTSKLTEIAELLGTSYRHLNRVVQKFCSEEIIERRNKSLWVKNGEKLKELADGSLYE
ncbi:Crp/Fnr family transcriptional regulator [Brevibacillus dissolubilis]|uniref:Crp/Fnr family transcriptional regulator n=1 Tax=Brevibacillus dissolubilis TaxID=1844116 RepID=UPI001117A5C6|nr:cyclic nucleotide-binding domain-containing protein [Brevibacillus dissolubilis]